MATALPTTNGNSAQNGENNFAVKAGLARMLKGGVIMDVINAEQVRFPPFHLFLLFSLSLALKCKYVNITYTEDTRQESRKQNRMQKGDTLTLLLFLKLAF